MLSTFKKDQVKGLLYNKFYGYFLIYTESAITVWNSFTGFKMFGFSLSDRGQPLGIKSLTATGCFGYSLTHYIVSVDSRLYHFDLIDNSNVVPEVQGRMLKYPKNSQEFAIEVQQVTHIEGDFEFQHSTFSSNFIKARCNQPNSKFLSRRRLRSRR